MSESSIAQGRFPGVGRKVSWFLIGSVLGIAALVVAVAYKQGAFARHVRVLAHTADASGLSSGMPVKHLGFNVGTVRDMRMRRNRVEVELAIAAEFAEQIPHGSRARLAREGLFGAGFVEILPPRDAAPGTRSIAHNEVLEMERGGTLRDAADELKRQIDPLLADMRRALEGATDPRGEVQQTLAAAREALAASQRTMEGLNETRVQLDRFIGEASTTVATVRESVAPLGEAVTRSMRESGAAVMGELPRMAASTSAAMAEVVGAAKELGSASKRVGEQLPEAAGRVSGVMQDARGVALEAAEIVEAVKRTWPVSATVRPTELRTLPIDINESGFPPPASASATARTSGPDSQ